MDDNPQDESVIYMPIGGLTVPGELIVPPSAKSIVIFAHGSGSSRMSPRNRYVAAKLQEHNHATLLFDLLTEEEDEDRNIRFDIDLLTERLTDMTQWIQENEETRDMSIAYFGASTGAAAAIKAAASTDAPIKAVISKGGRVDMAIDAADKVQAAVLLIVGEHDEQVIEYNVKVLDKLKSEKKLEIITGASHLFEEPGTLENAATLAADWCDKYLP